MNYLLACKTCKTPIPVSTGQAGQTLRCNCGAQIEVPSIRDLRNLPTAQDESTAGPAWGRRQGMFFVGGAIAVLALAAIAVLWLTRPQLVDVRKELGEPDLGALRAEINSVAPEENYIRYELIRPWPPKLFAEKKDEEVPPYLLASQELIKGFETGGNQFLAPRAARPIVEIIQRRSNQNLEAFYKQTQIKDWVVIAAVAGGIGLVIAAAGFLVPPERPSGRAAPGKRVPQSTR